VCEPHYMAQAKAFGTYSLAHSFVHSFIRSFIYSPLRPTFFALSPLLSSLSIVSGMLTYL